MSVQRRGQDESPFSMPLVLAHGTLPAGAVPPTPGSDAKI